MTTACMMVSFQKGSKLVQRITFPSGVDHLVISNRGTEFPKLNAGLSLDLNSPQLSVAHIEQLPAAMERSGIAVR